jgi:hypothetical protein
VYHVLLQLKSRLSRGDFFRIIQAPIADASAPGPASESSTSEAASHARSTASSSYVYLACNLLEAYAREEDIELLKDFYYQDDRRTESALLVLEEARGKEDLAAKITLIKDAHRLFSEDKERGVEARFADEYSKLLAFQSALEKEEGGRVSFVGLSINETIRQCLIKNMSKKAEKVRTDWKVPDKRFWSIKVSALISTRDLESLWSFANAKKSPIGYQPFISQLINAGFLKESLRYVPKCASDKSDRARLRSVVDVSYLSASLPLCVFLLTVPLLYSFHTECSSRGYHRKQHNRLPKPLESNDLAFLVVLMVIKNGQYILNTMTLLRLPLLCLLLLWLFLSFGRRW